MAVDGGDYAKTSENRPLVGPLPVAGGYVNAACSGFGIMGVCAGGELLAARAGGRVLPDYAAAFQPGRFYDSDCLDAFGTAGAADQL